MTREEAVKWFEKRIEAERLLQDEVRKYGRLDDTCACEQDIEACNMAIEALEQIRAIEGIIDVSNITIQEDVLKYKMIVDIVKGGGEPKKGKWKWTDGTYTCSECSYHAYGKAWEILNGVLQLCPNCGARMEVDGIDIK